MIGVFIITGMAFFFGTILVYLDSWSDDANEYLKYLPGYNCGACGFGSCKGMSEAMCKDVNNYKKCKPLKGETLKKMEAFLSDNLQ